LLLAKGDDVPDVALISNFGEAISLISEDLRFMAWFRLDS